MLITIGGNAALASSGCTIDSPSLTLSCTCEIAFAIIAFPAVSRVIVRDRKNENDHRVDHRGQDLVLDLLRLLLEFGQPRQDDFEDTAELPGLDHVDEEIVEDTRTLGQPFGERASALD